MIKIASVHKKGDKFVDSYGNIIPENMSEYVVVYSGRRELVAKVTDKDLMEKITSHLKTLDTLFPSIKALTTFLQKEGVEYCLNIVSKSTFV